MNCFICEKELLSSKDHFCCNIVYIFENNKMRFSWTNIIIDNIEYCLDIYFLNNKSELYEKDKFEETLLTFNYIVNPKDISRYIKLLVFR